MCQEMTKCAHTSKSCSRYLWVVSGRNPTQPKKSLRKPFSCMPTKPVAGEALSLHLLQQRKVRGLSAEKLGPIRDWREIGCLF